eukprot:1421475-Rhodomonas_salina.1
MQRVAEREGGGGGDAAACELSSAEPGGDRSAERASEGLGGDREEACCRRADPACDGGGQRDAGRDIHHQGQCSVWWCVCARSEGETLTL